MHCTVFSKPVGRLAAAIGIVAGLLLIGAGSAAAEEREAPAITAAFSNAPRQITIAWFHEEEGVYGYAIQLKLGDEWQDVQRMDHTFGQYTLADLEPATWYTLRVCAVYDPVGDDRACSEPETTVQTLAQGQQPSPPPSGPLTPPRNVQWTRPQGSTAASFTWELGTGATYYQIQCVDNVDGSPCGLPHKTVDGRRGLGEATNREQPQGQTTRFTLENLNPDHSYTVAICSAKPAPSPTEPDLTACAPDVTVPALPPFPPPLSKPALIATRLPNSAAVSLEFSVETPLNLRGQRFLLLRDGRNFQEVIANAVIGRDGSFRGYDGSYTDDTVDSHASHEYQACFTQREERACSDPVGVPRQPTGNDTNCTVPTDEIGLDNVEQELLDRINAFRRQNGAPPLTIDATLSKAALWASFDIVDRGGGGAGRATADDTVDYIDTLDRNVARRLQDCGYTASGDIPELYYYAVGAGVGGSNGAYNAFTTLPGYRVKLLDARLTSVGIGRGCRGLGSYCAFTLNLSTAGTGMAGGRPELPYGPDTCLQGYVWREAFDGDTICVTPDRRAQILADNAAAAARRSPTGGAYGPDTCLPGFVWRVARPEDLVCVSPEERDRIAAENAQPNAHRAAPR
jgi:hypothetical protein